MPDITLTRRQIYPIIFSIALIVVINVVMLLLQSGRAGLASTVLAGTIFLALLLAGLRRVS